MNYSYIMSIIFYHYLKSTIQTTHKIYRKIINIYFIYKFFRYLLSTTDATAQ